MQSTNEEMQSTQEVTTSKEEMQSLNEELQPSTRSCSSGWTSCPVEQRHEEPAQHTDIARFLDNDLRVRRFTTRDENHQLIPATWAVPSPTLPPTCSTGTAGGRARGVAEVVFRKATVNARGRSAGSRCASAYRTIDDRMARVVITFVDITVATTLEARCGRSSRLEERHGEECLRR